MTRAHPRVFAALLLLAGVATAHVLPATASPAPTHRLLIIGDSLTFGAEYFAGLNKRITKTARWQTAKVSAKVGRTINQGITELRAHKPSDWTAIVVALGTNDMLHNRDRDYPAIAIDRFMRASKGRPVLWQNLEFAPTRPDWRNRAIRFNRELRKAQSRWPNLHIADWNTYFTPMGPSRFISDGVHLTVSGYRTRAAYLTSQLKMWASLLDQMVATTTTTAEDSTTSSSTSSSTTPSTTPTTTP